MGLDIWMESKRCKECGHAETFNSFNYTYNVAPMWKDIYPNDKGMVWIDNMSGKEAEKKIKYALIKLNENPEHFIKMNPANGWGSYDTFTIFLLKLLHTCQDYPDGIWKTWR